MCDLFPRSVFQLYNMCDRSPFPTDVARLCSLLAGCVGWPQYSPEAAIVNFYHRDSTLAPHTDHSEWDMTAPLLSLRWGRLGGAFSLVLCDLICVAQCIKIVSPFCLVVLF